MAGLIWSWKALEALDTLEVFVISRLPTDTGNRLFSHSSFFVLYSLFSIDVQTADWPVAEALGSILVLCEATLDPD
jgi:hypothetical protein